MKISVIITTFNRPAMLARLVRSIAATKGQHEICMHIFDDGSTEPYDEAVEAIHKAGMQYEWLHFPMNHGKSKYWVLTDFAYSYMKDKEYDYVVQLPDDVMLVDYFFDVAVTYYESIADPYCICLNLLSDSRAGHSMWTNVQPIKVVYDGVAFWNAGWMDMCIIADSRYMEALLHKINTVPQEWAEDMTKSTGVGMQISQRLAYKYNLYQVCDSLVIHDEHESVMHPGEVKGCTNNVDAAADPVYSEQVVAGVASIPSRVESLKETVESILPQVDHLYVYLNEYNTTPPYLCRKKITVFHSSDELGDIGDAGKFYAVDKIKGFYLSIDDDIIYPDDYVKKMIKAVEGTGRGSVATLHGRNFDRFPIVKYYRGHSEAFRCTDPVYRDTYIMVPGTGVTCFHTSTLQLSIDDFEISNMADVWVGLSCQQQKVPVLCVAHNKGWVRMSAKYDTGNTIYSYLNGNDQVQVAVMNRIKKWRIYKPKKVTT